MCYRYYSNDPGADFDRWERDLTRLHNDLALDRLIEDPEDEVRKWAEWMTNNL